VNGAPCVSFRAWRNKPGARSCDRQSSNRIPHILAIDCSAASARTLSNESLYHTERATLSRLVGITSCGVRRSE